MHHRLFAILALVAVIAAGCGSRDELDAKSFGLSCGPNLDRYPVMGPHNGGYDANWNWFTCPPHPAPQADTSDFIAGRHLGNDIFGERGTPIITGRAGVVVHAGWDNTGGNRVTVRDECNWHYYYAHLDAIDPAVREGGMVTVGQVLGKMGKTGDAHHTAPHLHFSIYPDDNYAAGIDPFPYLESVDETGCLPPPAAGN
jgi:murein DD-endopeptidase MepM/ murein hydrolase activator NlpD